MLALVIGIHTTMDHRILYQKDRYVLRGRGVQNQFGVRDWSIMYGIYLLRTAACAKVKNRTGTVTSRTRKRITA